MGHPEIMQTAQEAPRTFLLASIALLAFAANSLLCRLALGGSAIDAAGFSAVRLFSGAIMLSALSLGLGRKQSVVASGNWTSSSLLFTYAITFSFAYQSLSTGTGALILFGSVQATMMIAGVINGERPYVGEWTGLVVALAGLVYLVFPGLEAPEPKGALLMIMAGISWGWYSLRGRGTTDPLGDTTNNFIRTLPFALLLCILSIGTMHFSGSGVLLAVGSGSIASGIGYAVWYTALRGLTAARASIIQLSVPVIAALGGVLFLSEEVTVRLLLAAALILGGVAIALRPRSR